MIKSIFTLLSILLLISQHLYAQGFDRTLYTSISIFSTEPKPFTAIPENEYCKLDSNIALSNYRKKGITAIIYDSTTISKYYNTRLLIGYFINNSQDTLLIDRCDDAILKSETQIFIDHKWVTFQLNLPSDCGVSYFTTKLPPKSYYVLHIPDPTDGDLETKFRIKFTYNTNVFYTNAVNVTMTRERIAKTKKKIKSIPWSY